MALTQSPDVNLEGFIYLENSLGSIQSGEARQIEANFRLAKMQAMIDSGDWEVDQAGNVLTADFSQDDKDYILEHARFSIIEEMPEVITPFDPKMVIWKSIGVIIGYGNTITTDYPGLVTLTIEQQRSDFE